MDWDLAIKRNSEALKGIIAALFAMLGLDGDAVSRIPRSLHRAVLRVLRPAESAVRRLIVIAARGLGGEGGAFASHAQGAQSIGKGGGPRFPPSSSSIRGKISRSCATPRKVHEASAAHPFLRLRSPGGACGQPRPVVVPPAAARWPGQCRTPHPQAPGPQVGP